LNGAPAVNKDGDAANDGNAGHTREVDLSVKLKYQRRSSRIGFKEPRIDENVGNSSGLRAMGAPARRNEDRSGCGDRRRHSRASMHDHGNLHGL
jgi:hypothetical protein